MISRLLLLFGCSQVFLLVVSCDNFTGNSTKGINITGVTRIREISENICDEAETMEKDVTKRDTGNLEKMGRDEHSDFVNPWYTSVPLLPIVFASSSTLPDGPCKKQSQRYLNDLKNGTLWATQMFDSSTKYPDGLINGHTRHLGDFDGCYNLRVKLPAFSYNNENSNEDDEEITGRYCLVDIRYEKQDSSPVKSDERHDLEFDPNDSVWEAIREKGDFRRIKRYMLQMALCVPEVCSSNDIEAALREPMKTFAVEKKLNLEVSVKPHFCQALKDAPKFSRSAKIYCLILALLITMVVVSTLYDFTLKDYNENFTSTKKDLILCFSARRNFNTLMEPTVGHRGLEVLYLMRFFYLTLTMIGHRIIQYSAAPVINTSYMEWLYKFKQSAIIISGPLIVESFFSIGGLLMTYTLLTELDARKKINLFGPIIIRFLRLTPAYMLIVFFNALLLPYLGSGPYWEWKIGLERDSCMNNWWKNLLYINNYANPEAICMFQSWYLAVDCQLYIIALIVVYVFWRMPRKIGYFFLSIVILGGCFASFLYTYVYNVEPMYRGLLPTKELRYDPYFTGHYVKTHERMGSYFIGVLSGAAIYDHSRAPWRLGKVSSNILFILFAVVFSFGSQVLGHKFYDPNANPTILEAAIYAGLHRSVFAIATVAIPLLITFGDGLDFHYNFLTPSWVQPWARLTYGAYLIHTVHQLYDVGITRIARSFGVQNLFWDYLPDVAFTFFLALLLAMIVEGPFRRIEKRFIMKRENSDPSNKLKEEGKKTN